MTHSSDLTTSMWSPMDFAQFIAWSQDASMVGSDVRRLCETRIARAFATMRPSFEPTQQVAKVHRCDLARRWCELRGLTPSMAEVTLISEGVRHGLGLVLQCMARLSKRVAIPRDVYPVYGQIATAAGVASEPIETFPEFDLQTAFNAAEQFQADVLLLPAPLKLQGRAWTSVEVDQAVAWLQTDRQKRLILDGVYSFGLPLDEPVKRLIDTGQVIYLDSLSKGWLHEHVLGVAIVPHEDTTLYTQIFRELLPSQAKLACAEAMLQRHHLFPLQLRHEMDQRRAALQRLIEAESLVSQPADRGYLLAIQASPATLLERYGLLTLPATVFGSRHLDWSIASALPVEASA